MPRPPFPWGPDGQAANPSTHGSSRPCANPSTPSNSTHPRQLKAEQEARLRAREAKLSRLVRSHKRKALGPEAEGERDGDDLKLKLRLFVGGLLDECPRCGAAPACGPEDRGAHKAHLRECKRDKGKARAHQEKVAAAEVCWLRVWV